MSEYFNPMNSMPGVNKSLNNESHKTPEVDNFQDQFLSYMGDLTNLDGAKTQIQGLFNEISDPSLRLDNPEDFTGFVKNISDLSNRLT